MRKPCPNCFVANFNDYDECEDHFWLCFALHQAGIFKPYIIGSVIPFIRKNEVADIIEQYYGVMQLKWDTFTNAVELLVKCQEQSQRISQHLVQIEAIKKQGLRTLLA